MVIQAVIQCSRFASLRAAGWLVRRGAGGAPASFEVERGSAGAAGCVRGSDVGDGEGDGEEGNDVALPLGATRIQKRIQRYINV